MTASTDSGLLVTTTSHGDVIGQTGRSHSCAADRAARQVLVLDVFLSGEARAWAGRAEMPDAEACHARAYREEALVSRGVMVAT